MWRVLGCVVLVGCISLTKAEDEPLPLDHPDAITWSEERAAREKKTSRSFQTKHVINNKNVKVVANKKGASRVKATVQKMPAPPLHPAKRKVEAKKAGKKS